jgi:OOP family OmpA-OmpF porin
MIPCGAAVSGGPFFCLEETVMKALRLLFMLLPLMAAGKCMAVAGDADNDGVADANDRCPDTAQLKMLPADFKYAAAVNPERLKDKPRAHPVDSAGCEFDSDNDGVVNSQDYCPENSPQQLSKGVASNGCPLHSDEDGTPDYRDRCPGTPRSVATDRFGCPKQG